MTWKTAVVELALSAERKGASPSIPRKLSPRELERLTRKFIDEIHDMIGPRHDIPAPDMGTDARNDGVDHATSAKVSRLQSGLRDRQAGRRLRHAEAAKKRQAAASAFSPFKLLGRLGRKPQDTRVAMQGFGNVGSHAAKFLHEAECKIVAVSDASGGYFRADGFDIPTDAAICTRPSRTVCRATPKPKRSPTSSCWSSTSSC